MIKEFKEFIQRGNVLDLAVGVIVGGAFSNIVTSLVNNIFTPIIGILFGGVDFSGIKIAIGKEQIMIGEFIQSIFDFFVTAICIFIIIKFVNRLNNDLNRKKKSKKEEIVEIKKSEDIILLTEIRDLLKEDKKERK